jgi:hypothetical protein
MPSWSSASDPVAPALPPERPLSGEGEPPSWSAFRGVGPAVAQRLGTRQTGLLPMRVADPLRDRELLPAVAEATRELLPPHRDRVPTPIRRWVGDRVDYGHV